MRLDSSSESCGADSPPGPEGNAEKSMWGLQHELKFADTFPPESVFAPKTGKKRVWGNRQDLHGEHYIFFNLL